MASQKLQENVEYECSQLSPFEPLVEIMGIVAREIKKRGGTFDKPKARRVWMELMTDLQGQWSSSDHHRRLPCRFCDQEFLPQIDAILLAAFLEWETTRKTSKLIQLHRCPACGGQITALDTRTYEGGFCMPEPNSIEDDEAWAELLLDNISEED